jgi:hypothetical protein
MEIIFWHCREWFCRARGHLQIKINNSHRRT